MVRGMEALTLIQTRDAAPGDCACCAAPADSTDAVKETTVSSTAPDATVAVYTVSGMTCGHCVKSVTEEVGALAGVSSVDVDLASGRVTVTSGAPLELDAVKAAVDEAGYEVVV
jgi:copper chaperone